MQKHLLETVLKKRYSKLKIKKLAVSKQFKTIKKER